MCSPPPPHTRFWEYVNKWNEKKETKIEVEVIDILHQNLRDMMFIYCHVFSSIYFIFCNCEIIIYLNNNFEIEI